MKNLKLLLEIVLWINMGMFLIYFLISNVIDVKLLLIMSPLLVVLALYKFFKKNFLLIISCIIIHVIYLITKESPKYYLLLTIICVVIVMIFVVVFQKFMIRGKSTESLIMKEIDAILTGLVFVVTWMCILVKALNGIDLSAAPAWIAIITNSVIFRANQYFLKKENN